MNASIDILYALDHADDPGYLRDGVRWCRHLAAQPDPRQLRDYLDAAQFSPAQLEFTCAAVASRGRYLVNVDHLDPIGRTLLATVEHLHEPIAQLLVRDPVFSARYALALNPTTCSKVLTQLAQDPDPMVCAAVAENPATNPATLADLATHHHQDVREWAESRLSRRDQ
jgi:hypothetical protein